MKIILGSKSPRRKELMEALGLNFEIRVKEVDETFPEDMEIDKIAVHIAATKCAALVSDLQPGELLICADTIVVLNDKVYGKPTNRSEAIQMLGELSGKTHTVITGVQINTMKDSESFFVKTLVTIKTLSQTEIEYYIDNHNPYDKAGSYGIQDWFGLTCVERIEGSYTNVVGLPTAELYSVLKSFI